MKSRLGVIALLAAALILAGRTVADPLAPSNAALVEKAVAIIEAMGEDLATPAEARAMLGLRKAA